MDLTRRAARHEKKWHYPKGIDTPAKQALYDNLAQDATLTIQLDQKIRAVKKADWRGQKFKEKEVRNAIVSVLETQMRETEIPDVDIVLELVRNQSDY